MLFFVLPLLFSCASNLYRKYPVMLSDYDVLIENLENSNDRIDTDRRVFDFHFRRGIYSVKGEGVFLYRKPDRMRIDLYVGTAELVFQYFRAGDRSSAVFPRDGRIVESTNGEILLTGIEGMEGVSVMDNELKAVMLGLYDLSSGMEWLAEVREGKEGYLLSLKRGEESCYLQIDPETHELLRYDVFSSGRKRREIRYSSFQEIKALERPWSVTYEDKESGFEIKLSIRNEVINEEISPDLFHPPLKRLRVWD